MTGLSFAKIRLRSEPIAVSAATINVERTMDRLLLLILGVIGSVCRSRADLVLENAALRHQLGVLMRAIDQARWRETPCLITRSTALDDSRGRVWTVVGWLDTRSRHADRVMAKDNRPGQRGELPVIAPSG